MRFDGASLVTDVTPRSSDVPNVQAQISVIAVLNLELPASTAPSGKRRSPKVENLQFKPELRRRAQMEVEVREILEIRKEETGRKESESAL